MENSGFLKLQFDFLDISASPVFDVYINKNRIPTDPGLAMKTSSQLHHLGIYLL